MVAHATGATAATPPARRDDVNLVQRRNDMSLELLLLIVLVLVLIGVFPAWPHSRSWGYRPSGALGVVLIVVLVLFVLGMI